MVLPFERYLFNSVFIWYCLLFGVKAFNLKSVDKTLWCHQIKKVLSSTFQMLVIHLLDTMAPVKRTR